jgi:hypothetical protein
MNFIQKFLAALKPEQYITIRYEDLIVAPRQTLTNIAEFLQLEFSESMLDYAKRNREDKLEPKETMLWKLKLNEDLEMSNIGKFRILLTKQEIAIFESRCGDFLNYYGYK